MKRFLTTILLLVMSTGSLALPQQTSEDQTDSVTMDEICTYFGYTAMLFAINYSNDGASLEDQTKFIQNEMYNKFPTISVMNSGFNRILQVLYASTDEFDKVKTDELGLRQIIKEFGSATYQMCMIEEGDGWFDGSENFRRVDPNKTKTWD